MKRSFLTGWQTVFKFTLSRQLRSRSYIALTLIFAILLFSVVAGFLIIPNFFYSEEPSLDEAVLSRVILCGGDIETLRDAEWMSEGGLEMFAEVEYITAGTLEEAAALTDEYSLIVAAKERDGAVAFTVISPDGSMLTKAEINAFTSHLNASYRTHLILTSGIDPSILADLYAPINTQTEDITDPDTDDHDPEEAVREAFNMILSYLMIFILYMMILFYGQGTAASVILEKTSKLMDFFLVSVKPSAMILGKVLSTAIAAFVQVLSWGTGIVLGFLVGKMAVGLFDVPSPTITGIIEIFEGLDGMFSPAGVLISVLVVVAGFLLYCSIAAIGGAMASKPEDLSSTNLIFTLVLIVSFLLSLYSGASDGMVSTSDWLIYFPFTAILVTPGRALAGSISVLEGAISAALVALLAFAGVVIAGRVYEMMSFYRGNPPSPAKLFSILRDSMKKSGAENK